MGVNTKTQRYAHSEGGYWYDAGREDSTPFITLRGTIRQTVTGNLRHSIRSEEGTHHGTTTPGRGRKKSGGSCQSPRITGSHEEREQLSQRLKCGRNPFGHHETGNREDTTENQGGRSEIKRLYNSDQAEHTRGKKTKLS